MTAAPPIALEYQRLLDFNSPFDVDLFDRAVNDFFVNGNTSIQTVLVQFQDHPSAWQRVDVILDSSQNQQSKILALNILERTVQYKWLALPRDQQQGIRTYIVNLIIKLSHSSTSLRDNKHLLNKLNLVLVQIVKHSWPHQWPDFITELVNSSKASESIASNNMAILQLLSEEIFDYSSIQMTAEKAKVMKTSLNQDFSLIFQLCSYILEHSTDAQLLTTTLKTLLRFLQWIPIGYIFETSLIEQLVLKFFPVQLFQNDTLQCLGEIAGLQLRTDDPTESKYFTKLVQLYIEVIKQVQKLITADTDVSKIYNTGDHQAQSFLRYLTLFITGFLKVHATLLENQQDDAIRQTLVSSLDLLLRLSRIDDVVIWKICLEYWNILVADLYSTQRMYTPSSATAGGGASSNNPNASAALFNISNPFARPPESPRLQLYSGIMSRLRLVMIQNMAKPEEVLIVEDENGEIVRESMKDTDAITLYKSMREGLIFLTHLDPQDTQDVMLNKLQKQVDGSEWSWNNLNKLCWGIGSISGALSEQAEKSFLVRVIKDLLGLVEMKRGKDHKAVIASNIMYVVGQYPRFLRQHWKFLKTVVNKLFEFMHETHPGVQDMSVDTFLKIAKKCRKKFTQLQQQEQRPFIDEIIENLHITIADLDSQQIHGFYEACGEIVASEADTARRQQLVFGLMELPNKSWTEIIGRANTDAQSIYDSKVVKQVVFVLKTNSRVAMSIGSGYIVQLARIYVDMLQLYKMYSSYISQRIAEGGAVVTKTAVVRGMRSVKKEVLSLIRTFVQSSDAVDRDAIRNQFLPALIDPVLDDYKRNVADARDSEVLLLFAAFTDKLGAQMIDFIPRIFDSTFEVTLTMITRNFEDYPDIRHNFFRLLQSINLNCFVALLRFNQQQFQLVIDSIIWAVKHLERNIADTGLQILLDLINNVASSEVANTFFTQFYVSLLQDLLGVLTDTFHKPGFKLQSTILAKLFQLVQTGQITTPLWNNPTFNPTNTQYANNQQYVKTITVQLLRRAFSNLTNQQIDLFVNGCFAYNNDLQQFKTHLRDFLIQLKEFGGVEANEELFLEEQQLRQQQQERERDQKIQAVPGLAYAAPIHHGQHPSTPPRSNGLKAENGIEEA